MKLPEPAMPLDQSGTALKPYLMYPSCDHRMYLISYRNIPPRLIMSE
jgi:hypothetical protein